MPSDRTDPIGPASLDGTPRSYEHGCIPRVCSTKILILPPVGGIKRKHHNFLGKVGAQGEIRLGTEGKRQREEKRLLDGKEKTEMKKIQNEEKRENGQEIRDQGQETRGEKEHQN